jgi:hypothetical protein
MIGDEDETVTYNRARRCCGPMDVRKLSRILARRRKPVGAASPEATRLPTANHATDFAVDKPKLRKR